MGENEKFVATFEYKLIYVFRINDKAHKGVLKIGDATIHTEKKPEDLTTFCDDLNAAADKRIAEYTGTAGITYELLHTEIALYINNDTNSKKYGKLLAFRDHDVHNVLKRSGVKNRYFDTTRRQNEWFECDLETAKRAIKAVKEGKSSLNPNQVTDFINPIIFRPEQKEAIEKTLKQYKKSDRMLWNAKMRFGKTLTALEVAKRSDFKKTIIITHRPVVSDGWYEDFSKIFYDKAYWSFGSKSKGKKLKEMIDGSGNFVYFASMQDLRGSNEVGGNFDKNDLVFKTDWDFVVVDEAHEGTQTKLGKTVLETVIRSDDPTHVTKTLELSGTPFNLLVDYEDNEIYTWDYIMEQETKLNWPKDHFLDTNPYEELPKLNIFTYHLEDTFRNYQDVEDKAFNFKEFFRTWTGDKLRDFKEMPMGASIGDFVHEDDIKSFLKLICKTSSTTNYPFANQKYRNFFRHTLWIVPGVKEAKALSKLLKADPIFSQFEICNVAGVGDEEIDSRDALTFVKDAMGANPNETRTITLSCGRLTTGVSVPEWTAVLMLAGSYSTQASQYLQTIFRVQTPANIDGKIKENCYVFDFAPDRTLKMIAESVQLSQKGFGTKSAEFRLGQFLNYCPVISMSDTEMKEYKVSYLLQELKKAYAERVVRNGFDDTKLYNDELLKLDDVDLREFERLQQIIGKSQGSGKTSEIDINDEGFTGEEREIKEELSGKKKKDLTEEEEKHLAELNKRKKERTTAISILRGISIRIPLLVYGANVPIDKDINIENFPDLVDPISWDEFMPKGVTKPDFKRFSKYYDKDIFVASTYRIRYIAKAADELEPLERIKKITQLFSTFKNPDKETVLTPWRVVNLHMAQTIGGYCFWDENFENELPEPRLVNIENVTDEIFKPNGKVLEINSKTGLYPLYVTYSYYAFATANKPNLTFEEKQRIWNDIVFTNVFVVCKTSMAKSITKRTLLGYQDEKINAQVFDNLVDQMKEKQEQITREILKPSFWNKGGDVMKFNAVVGNPPYQKETAKSSAKNGQAPRTNIFQHFQEMADSLSPQYISLIYPGARWILRFGKGLTNFGLNQINDKRLLRLDFYPKSSDIFPEASASIPDGITLVLKSSNKSSNTFEYYYHDSGEIDHISLHSPGESLIELDPKNSDIVSKISNITKLYSFQYLDNRILSRSLFKIESEFVEDNPNLVRVLASDSKIDYRTEAKLFANDKAGKAGRGKWYIINKNDIPANIKLVDEWQVVVSSANAGGHKRDYQIEIMDNHSAFGRSRVALGTFKTEEEATNFYNYMKIDLVKFAFLMTDDALTSLGKKVPDLMDYTSHNKYIDFTKDLNEQVNKLFGLTEKEVNYIHEVVINHRKKR